MICLVLCRWADYYSDYLSKDTAVSLCGVFCSLHLHVICLQIVFFLFVVIWVFLIKICLSLHTIFFSLYFTVYLFVGILKC